MADGFLGRWSRRKALVRQGVVLEEPLAPAAPAEPPSPQPSPAGGRGSEEGRGLSDGSASTASPAVSPSPSRGAGRGEGTAAPASDTRPTLADTQSLTPASDFSRFVAPDVAPQVKNAALKRLFADPHFNVMDGMDVYIDDYSRPDPLSPGMLRQLASAEVLGLFREDDRPEPPAEGARDVAEELPSGSVAQSAPPAGGQPTAAMPAAALPDHAHPDLRLQQDDAAGPGGPGRGAG